MTDEAPPSASDGGPPPSSDGFARLPTDPGARLGVRLLGASFVALACALLARRAEVPPRLPEGALAPRVEEPEPEPEAGLRPGEPLVVVALGAIDPVYALRRLGPNRAAPPDLFAPLAPLLKPAHFRLLGIGAIDPVSPGAVPGPLVTDEAAGLVGRGNFDLAVLGAAEPERAGRRGLLEGAARLRDAGPSTLGAGETPDETIGPLRLLVEGRRVAWLALDARAGPAAGADRGVDELARRLKALRAEGEADAVVVAVHAGERYATAPSEPTRRLFHALADAGADVVLGLRPAVLQGVEWRGGVPLVYGLGNPLSPSDREHPEAGVSALARLRFVGKGPPSVELCPLRAEAHGLAPLASDALRFSYETALWQRVRLAARPFGGLTLGPPGPEGCAPIGPPAPRAKAGSP